ncbi:T9SS type A sorting domain-containing protein [Flavobacterium sp. '19STA2R22 D10 B1']|uniref:T9SS type A sorting domain-containing protein n=1 Tax=Flavobacterium aerium TaxID=3037261 RepID=UPI00278C7DD2|nr:T9SS type A sorting domain-containing protein [Flavobacterium sp. '19STA2R22 D10 B1']
MKSKLLCLCLLLWAGNTSLFAQNPEKRVLFVGNSITYFNDMPILFRDVANNKGKNVTTQMYAPGGTGFVNHVADANVYNLFKNNVWDVVVLQPGSNESGGTSASVNTTIERGKRLMDSIKKYSPCAKILLYEISNGIQSAVTYPNYFVVQTRIKDSLTKMADGLQIPMIPAGESARMHYTAQQDLLLHGSFNDIHPNLNGSYLIAATMYAAIFQEPVTGTTFYGGIPQARAEYFHGIADQVVLPNKAQWRINMFNLHSDFNYVVNGNTVDFTNAAANYTTLEWDFGDGTIVTDLNPSHVFLTNGIKTIKLKAIRNGCEEIIEKQITIGSLSVADFDLTKAVLYPNPAKDLLNFRIPGTTGNERVELSLYDLSGRRIFSNKVLFSQGNYTLDLNNLHCKSGIYLVRLKSDTIDYNQKISIQ